MKHLFRKGIFLDIWPAHSSSTLLAQPLLMEVMAERGRLASMEAVVGVANPYVSFRPLLAVQGHAGAIITATAWYQQCERLTREVETFF